MEQPSSSDIIGVSSPPKHSNTTATPAKIDGHPVHVDPTPSLVDFKNGRLSLKQKKLPLDRQPSTLREQLEFQTFIDDLDPSTSLDHFPEKHLPLVAKYTHESEKSLVELAKQIKNLLRPAIEDPAEEGSTEAPRKDFLPLSILQAAISSVAKRVNYGVTATDFETIVDPETITVPNSLCIWRWEANDLNNLPHEVVEKARKRIEERKTAKETAKQIIVSLDRSVLESLFSKADNSSSKASGTLSVKKMNAGNEKKKTHPNPEKEANMQEAKRRKMEKKAKEEEKRIKEQKAQENMNKEAGRFASFFKPKASLSSDAGKILKPPENEQSDFDQTFKKFHVRRNVTVAPVNAFLKRRGAKDYPVMLVDDDDNDDDEMEDIVNTRPDLSTNEVISEFQQFAAARPVSFRTRPPICVADVMNAVNKGSLVGMDSSKYWEDLRNSNKVRIKLLKFAEDCRPGYVGTWTKPCGSVGPRRPTGKDTGTLNYEVDSEAEWEEEGEDAEDVNDDDNKSEEEEEEDDDDDGFFCGDDEIEMMEGYEYLAGDETENRDIHLDEDSMDAVGMMKNKNKRNRENAGRKRIIAGPLVPVAVGAVWEPKIGETSSAFESFRIQFLNDAKRGLNPFVFESKPISETVTRQSPSKPTTTSLSSTTYVNAKASVEKIPRRKTGNPRPKTKFPEELMQDFATTVESSENKTKAGLMAELTGKYLGRSDFKITKASLDEMVKNKVTKRQSNPTESDNGRIWIV